MKSDLPRREATVHLDAGYVVCRWCGSDLRASPYDGLEKSCCDHRLLYELLLAWPGCDVPRMARPWLLMPLLGRDEYEEDDALGWWSVLDGMGVFGEAVGEGGLRLIEVDWERAVELLG